MDGIIIINKPKEYTSHDVVQKAKKILNEKIGHTGTLDPMATGVLPLLVGKGTLCSKYLMNHDKIYEVQLTLGKKTDTADADGKIIEEKEIPEKILEQQNIKKVLTSFLGKQEQLPPMYSAIKVNGKKLYEYARKGKKVEVPSRQIEIYEIKLEEINIKKRQINFYVHCSKGTYIRSLCEDIANKLDTIGYMTALKRIQVGEFNIKDAIEIEKLEEYSKNPNQIEKYLITIEQQFKNKESIYLDTKKLELFLNGVKLTQSKKDEIYKIYHQKTFIGIGIIQNALLKRDIIL